MPDSTSQHTQQHTQQRTPADTPSPTPPGDEAVGGGAATSGDLPDDASIVDAVLDLDDFLSGDVRRATRRVPFSTRPDLEAEVDDLERELIELVDANGRPLPVDDDSLAGPTRALAVLEAEYRQVRAEYRRSIRVIEIEALADEDFDEFKRIHPAVVDTDAKPEDRNAAFDKLVVACAKNPKFTDETLAAFRKKVGTPVMATLVNKVWEINTTSGVSVPKSPLFSLVQKHMERARS